MFKTVINSSMNSGLKNEGVAVITGASRRLGLYLTEALLSEGWTVHAVTRTSSSDLRDLKHKYDEEGNVRGGMQKLYVHSFDYYAKEQKNVDRGLDTGSDAGKPGYNEHNVNQALADILKISTKIHLLVNNASIFDDDKAVADGGMDVYADMVFMHMILPALMTRGLSHALTDNECPGNVVSITDIYAQNPNPDFSLYCSTKAGLENLNKGFAKKYAPGLRVNAIQPGPIKFLPEHGDEHKSQVIAETLLPFEGGFLPIYQTLQLILVNQYLTGASIPVDGGRSLVRG